MADSDLDRRLCGFNDGLPATAAEEGDGARWAFPRQSFMKLLRTLASVPALLAGATAWIATPVHAGTATATFKTSASGYFTAELVMPLTDEPAVEILIAETASAEQCGSKADWNTALISYLAAQPDITAITRFHFNKETDWRINSSTASAQSFAAPLAARLK